MEGIRMSKQYQPAELTGPPPKLGSGGETCIACLRNLLDGSLEGVSLERPGEPPIINSSFAGLFGYSSPEEAAESGGLLERIMPTDRQAVAEHLEKCGSGQPSAGHYEAWGAHRGGGRIRLDIHARKVDWNGDPAIQLTIHDISSRLPGDGGRDWLAAVVEQAEECVLITDTGGAIIYVNTAFEKITGYSREEAVGENPRLLKSDKQDQQFYYAMWRHLKEHGSWKGSYTNRRKDGSLYEAATNISSIRDAGGKITNYVAVQREVTPAIQEERRLRRRESIEVTGSLAGGVIHDLNNLLIPILSYTELAMGGVERESEVMADLKEVYQAAGRARELLSEVLRHNRGKDGEFRVVDLKSLVLEVLALQRSILPDSIQVRPSIAKVFSNIKADPVQMHRMVMNLIVNARQAMPDGGELLITVHDIELEGLLTREGERVSGSFVRLGVTDTGVGMDEELLSRIFEPRFTTKEEKEGTGLGLPTVREIVKEHGGHIELFSKPGVGTTFNIYLPACKECPPVEGVE